MGDAEYYREQVRFAAQMAVRGCFGLATLGCSFHGFLQLCVSPE
jgi:hypothetical protein